MDPYLKALDERLKQVLAKFEEEIRGLLSGRPSVELIENLKVSYFDQWLPIKQLGSISLAPPREIRISVWDKASAGPVTKAIEDANAGFSVSNEGGVIRAMLSPLSNERREELMKLAKKMTEGFKIEVRNEREDAIKKVKAAQDKKEMTEDDVADAKEKIQKRVTAANESLEIALQKKIAELSE